MRKLAAICGFLALFIVPAMTPLIAQEQPQTDQSQTPPEQTPPAKPKRTHATPKFELSAGYAHRTYYSTDLTTLGTNGWYVSFEDNFKRWIGLDADVADTGENQGFILGNTHIYTFLVGPQVYPLGHRKLSPFGHFFYGAGYYRDDVPPCCGYRGNAITSLVRVWQGGGGLDLNLSQHWGVRVVQVDVASGNFFPNTSTYTNRSMLRVSAGVVYRFGQR
jgi:hypothetical protein